MKKKTKVISSNVQGLDVLSFVMAIVYFMSVLRVAHHTSHWLHDGTSRIVESPAVAVLVIGLVLIGYSWTKAQSKLSVLNVIALTIFATASLFWLSGLRTNFYF